MATQATVQLVVDESGAIPGLARFQQQATQAMQQPAAAAKVLGTQLTGAGLAGAKAGQQISTGMQQANRSVLSNIESVRLLSEDMGVHVPRAMQRLIAQTQAFQAVASVAFSAFAAVGFIELAGVIGEKIWGWAKAFEGDTKAAEDLRQKLVEISNQAIINPTNIDEARKNLNLLLSDQQKQQDIANSKYFSGKGLFISSDKRQAAGDQAAKDAEMIAQLSENTAKLNEDFAAKKRRADDENAENALQGIAKIRRQNQDANDEVQRQVSARTLTQAQADQLKADNNRKYALDEQHLSQETAKADQHSRQEAADEMTRLQRAAVEAGMQGEELANQKHLYDIEDLKKKLTDLHQAEMIPAAVQASNDAFFKEQQQRIAETAQKAQLAIGKYGVDAMAQGPEKIQGEFFQKARENQVNISGPDERAAADHAAYVQMNEQLAAFYKEQNDKKDQAAKEDQERRDRNATEDLDYEKRAADAERRVKANGLTGWVGDYKAAIAEIEAAQQEQMTKLRADAEEKKLTDTEISQRYVDINRTAAAEVAEQNRQAAHQLSQTLEEAYSNPIGFIKSRMQKMFFEIVAEWIERTKLFQGVFGQSMGNLQPGSGARAGGILGALGIGPHPTFAGSPSISGAGGGYTSGASTGDVAAPADVYRPAYTGGAGGSTTGGASSQGVGQVVSSTVGDARSLYGTISTARNTPGSPLSTLPGDVGAQGGIATAGIPGTTDDIGSASHEAGHSTDASATGKGASEALGIAGAGMAAYSSIGTTDAAFKSGSLSGTLQGAMGDAMAGAAIGSIVPGIGTVIGAGVGAAVGAASGIAGMILGEGGRLAARDYYKKSLFPEIERERNSNDATDYQTAVADINKTARDGMTYMTSKWGSGAADWVNANYLRKEQLMAVSQIEARARGGAYATSMSASQFHDGGSITDFGDLATSSNEGFIHAMLGEAVVNPVAASTHGPAISAMNAGASPGDIGQMYGGGGSGGGGDTHYHNWTVNALDSRSFEHFLRNGGAQSIVKHTNKFATRYAGDGIAD